jgi:hypothetical protein
MAAITDVGDLTAALTATKATVRGRQQPNADRPWLAEALGILPRRMGLALAV